MNLNVRIFYQIGGWAAMLLAIGCASSPSQLSCGNPMELQGSAETVWRQCQMELKQRGFELDRVDQRTGIIQTYALTSAHWFECWQNDLADVQSRLESNLQTVRRKVRMQVDPDLTNSTLFQIHCCVEIERLTPNADSVQRAGVVGVRDVFGSTVGRAPGLSPRTKKGQESVWEPLGTDPAMEQQILSSLARRIQNTDGNSNL